MGSDIKDAAAAAAARRAAQEAAARKAAQEAAARAVAAAKARLASQPKAAQPVQKNDELSTGQGGALRRNAVSQLGATGVASASASTPSTPTAKSQPLSFKVNAFGGFTPRVDPASTPAQSTPAGDGYDQIENARAKAAQQKFLDDNTQGLTADEKKKVQDAATVVASSGNGITDPAARAKAVASAIDQQSAQFKGDPQGAQAFAKCISAQVQGIGTDLTPSIQNNQDTSGAMSSLAHACDNLGPTASMDVGRQLANGLPDTKNLGGFGDVMTKLGGASDGGKALLFGTATGLQLSGKPQSFEAMKGPMRDANPDVQPFDLNQPIDPKDPEAVGKAELALAQSRWTNARNEYDGEDGMYVSQLSSVEQSLAGNPAALQQVMQSQRANIEDSMMRHQTDGPTLNTVLRAAQAEGNGELDRLAKEYAGSVRNVEVANDLDPSIAKSLAFAYRDAGSVEDAKNFAARASHVLDDVTSRAKDADDKMTQLQDKLDKELAAVGPGLDKTQKAAYEQKFWAEHQKEIGEQKNASADLEQQVKANQADLKQLAAIDPAAGQALGGALKELSNNPSEAAFVKSSVEGLVDPATKKFPEGFEGAEEDLVTADANATQSLAHQALTKGDEGGAVEQLKQLHEFLENTNFATNEVREFVQKGLPALKDFTAVVEKAAQTHDIGPVTEYLSNKENVDKLEEAGKAGPLGSLLSNVTKSVGVAAYLADAANTKDGKQQVLDVMNASQGSAELIASGFHAISDATKEATNTALKAAGKGLGELADVLDKVTPVLAFGVSLVQGFSDLGDAMKNPSVKSVGAAVGDGLTTLGAAVALFPGGEAVGGAIAFAGAAVSIVSNFVQGILDDNERKDDEKRLLGEVYGDSAKDPSSPLYGMTQDQISAAADRMVNCGTNLADLANNASLTPDQVVKLAAALPEMNQGGLFAPMADIARLSGLKGQDFVSFITGLEAKGTLGNQLNEILGLGGVSEAQKDGYDNETLWDENHPDATGQARTDGEAQAYRQGYDGFMQYQLKRFGLIP